MGMWILDGLEGSPVTIADIPPMKCVICGKPRAVFFTWTMVDDDDVDSITVELCGDPTCLYNTRKWIKAERSPAEILGQTPGCENSQTSSVSWWASRRRRISA